MIVKLVTRRQTRLQSSFGRLVDYLTHSKDLEHRVAGVVISNCYSQDVYGAAAEVEVTQSLNTRMKTDPVEHIVVSFHDDDRERVSEQVFARIESEICRALGYSTHQRIRVVHNDTDALHFHLAISRIDPKTYRVVDPHGSKECLADMCEWLEVELGLRRTRHHRSKGEKKGRYRDFEVKTGRKSLTAWMREVCLDELLAAKSWSEFHRVLASHGVEMKIKGRGFSFVAGRASAKPSDVSRELSRAKLEAKMGPFVPGSNESGGRSSSEARYNSQPENASSFSQTYWQKFTIYEVKRRRRAKRKRALLDRLKWKAVGHYLNRDAFAMLDLYRRAKRLRARVRSGSRWNRAATRPYRRAPDFREEDLYGSYTEFVRTEARRTRKGAAEELRARSQWSPQPRGAYVDIGDRELRSSRHLVNVTRNGVRVFFTDGCRVHEFSGRIWCPDVQGERAKRSLGEIAREFGVENVKIEQGSRTNQRHRSGSSNRRLNDAGSIDDGSHKKSQGQGRASSNAEEAAGPPPPGPRRRLRLLSEVAMVHPGEGGQLLLSSDVRRDLEFGQSDKHDSVRRRRDKLESRPPRYAQGRLVGVGHLAGTGGQKREDPDIGPPPTSRGKLRSLSDVPNISGYDPGPQRNQGRSSRKGVAPEVGYCRPVTEDEIKVLRAKGLGPLLPPQIRKLSTGRMKYAVHTLEQVSSEGGADYFGFLRRKGEVYVVRLMFSSQDDAKAILDRRYMVIGAGGSFRIARSKGIK